MFLIERRKFSNITMNSESNYVSENYFDIKTHGRKGSNLKSYSALKPKSELKSK